jgi:DNA polymerase (family 10)
MTQILTSPVSIQHNKELAAIFKNMSDCYKYLGNKERFRAIAYDTASKTLSNLNVPVDIYHDDIKKLDELKGVGESIAAKIIEYLDDGSINTFEQLKQKVPFKLLDLLEIEGIGPATIKKISEHLNVLTLEELKNKIIKEKTLSIKGVSKTQMKNILSSLKISINIEKRIPLKKAVEIGNNILSEINNMPGVLKGELAGSIRRKKETIGDIDIVILAEKKNNKSIIDQFIALPIVKNVISAGRRKASVVLKEEGIKADIQLVSKEEYGSSILYFTGSKEHNIALRSLAKKKGWKLNEYGLFDLKTNGKLAGESESDIYEKLGFKFIPPEKRIGKNEFSGEYTISG